MGHTRLWLFLTPLAVTAIVLGTASVIVGHDEAAAKAQAKAMAALDIQEGDCAATSDPLFVEVDEGTFETQAAGRSGWIGTRFVGSIDELAVSKGGRVVATSDGVSWVLSVDDEGHSFVAEYIRIEMKAGRQAWQRGETTSKVPCPVIE